MEGVGVRIVAFSDPHVDINNELSAGISKTRFQDVLISVLNEKKPDILICAGDVTPNTELLQKTLKEITEEINSEYYLFVPGNHDIWYKSPADDTKSSTSSLDKYIRVLPEVCDRAGFHYLPQNPLSIENKGFLGTCGWYDYTYRDPTLDEDISMKNYEDKALGAIGWNDVVYADWKMSDPEVCEWMLENLESGYQQLQRKGVIDMMLIMHHVPYRQFVTYKDEIQWDFCSAFMGTQKFGDWACSHQISSIIFGHTHSRHQGKVGETSVHCNPIGLLFEANELNVTKFIQNRLIILDW